MADIAQMAPLYFHHCNVTVNLCPNICVTTPFPLCTEVFLYIPPQNAASTTKIELTILSSAVKE